MLEARRDSRMSTVTTIAAVRAQVAAWRAARERVVFVPTMGNLHAGHVSLIEAARRHGKRFVASIFVNPMQFGPNEDFAHYPRTPAQDAKMLADAGCDLMFMPEVGEIYPNGADQATRVEVPGISNILCGEFRPGHFEGVATVVAKLFNIVDAGRRDFRREGLSAAHGDPPHGRGPVPARGDRRRADGARTRRARHELAQPVPRRGSSAGSRPLSTGSCSRRWRHCSPACVSTRRLKPRAARRSMAPDSAPTTSACATRRSLAPAKPDTKHFVVLTASRLGKARLIDNVQYTAG